MRAGAALLASVLALAAAGGGAIPVPGHGSRPLGPTAPGTRIAFALSLKLKEGLLRHDLAAGRTEPAGAAALGRRYGLPLADERRVIRALAGHGIAVVGTYPQRTEIDATASVRVLGPFFGVRFRDHRAADGSVFHAPTGEPVLPRALRPFVSGVVGLSTRPMALPGALPHGALRPDDATLAYDVGPLHDRGIDGRGKTIAVVSLEPFPPNRSDTRDDVSTFRRTFHASGPDPVDVKVDGGGTENDLSEDLLDIDVMSAIAPGAQIVNFEAPKTGAGNVDVFAKLVAARNIDIASFSWGICDSGLPDGFRRAVQHELQLAVLRGLTIFVSSGDSGSYDCQRNDFANHSLTVDFPSDSPQVVSVGGTLLSVTGDGKYVTEAGWEEPFSYAGGGGGVNTHDPAPSWQQAAHVTAGGHRVLPDVSASASSSSGWLVRDYGHWDSFGGTSAASPFWAASMLLAEQLAAKQGLKRTCFLAPILYRLATTKQPYPPFHDVTRGGNRYYDARPGWDYATGFGSPDVYNLARDLVAYLRAHGCGPGA